MLNGASRPRRASKRRRARIIEPLPRSLRYCDTRDLERTLLWMQRGLLPTYRKIERIQAELQGRERAAHEGPAKRALFNPVAWLNFAFVFLGKHVFNFRIKCGSVGGLSYNFSSFPSPNTRPAERSPNLYIASP